MTTHQLYFRVLKIKKAIEVEAYEYLITAWLKIFFRWKKIILDTLNELISESTLDDQVKWQYLKYNIRKHTITFSKDPAKTTNKAIADLETKLKHFEKHENYVDKIDYKVYKQQLDRIYEKKAIGIKIRSKCNWYEHGEKVKNPLFFF